MKKLITVILVLALLLPAAALGSDPDPIVGYWYMFIDLKAYPELSAAYGDYDHLISLYYFDESGVIYLLENDVKAGSASPVFTGGGKWEKAQDGYNVSIIGLGETTLSISDDIALLNVTKYSVSAKLRKIITFNPYTDYVY